METSRSNDDLKVSHADLTVSHDAIVIPPAVTPPTGIPPTVQRPAGPRAATNTPARSTNPQSGRRDLVVREALVIVAYVAMLIRLPGYVTIPLVCAAGLLTIERLVRRPGLRTRGLLVVAAGLAATLGVLVGVLLVVPHAHVRIAWSTAAAAIALAALANCLRSPAPRPLRLRQTNVTGTTSYALSVVAFAIAAVTMVHAVERADRPALKLSANAIGVGALDVRIAAGPAAGTYDLLVKSGSSAPVVKGPFSLAAGESVVQTVQGTPGEDVTFSLVVPGTTVALRSLTTQWPTVDPYGIVASIPPLELGVPAPAVTSARPTPALGNATPLPTVALQLPSP